MPELPEVETTVRGLRKVLINNIILDIWFDAFSDAKIFRNTIKNKKYFNSFKKNVIGAKIISVNRRGKNIFIELNNAYTIVIHMKMTGHLMYGKYIFNEKPKDGWSWSPTDKKSLLNDRYNRHIHLVFSLSNKHELVFSDSRKFGTVEIFKTKDVEREKISKIGREPLDDSFSFTDFKAKIIKSQRAIKTTLLDQKIIAGIGNIYSDEMLFMSHILPFRKASSLTDFEMKNLFKNMKKVLENSILLGGDSMSDYRNIFGEKGGFQNRHLVYLRNGEKCKTKGCKGLIKKQKINGRSSHFCEICQK